MVWLDDNDYWYRPVPSCTYDENSVSIVLVVIQSAMQSDNVKKTRMTPNDKFSSRTHLRIRCNRK